MHVSPTMYASFVGVTRCSERPLRSYNHRRSPQLNHLQFIRYYHDNFEGDAQCWNHDYDSEEDEEDCDD